MKVYIVGLEDYDGLDILGVYSSREKAIESFPYLDTQLDEENIFEYDLDKPNLGEKFQLYYFCNMNKDGRKWNGTIKGKSSFKPYFCKNDIPDGSRNALFSGYGYTLEEAEINCEKAKNES